MVFEFTGKPPACGAPTTFASFTPILTLNTPTRSPFPTASFRSSFGVGGTSQTDSIATRPFGAINHAQTSRDTTPPDEDIPQDDDLMRAFRRVVTNRQAVFGRRDMNADAALNEVLGLCDLDARKLMEALGEASSEVGIFARAVFSTLLQRHTEVKISTPPPEKTEERVPRWLSGEKRRAAKKARLEDEETEHANIEDSEDVAAGPDTNSSDTTVDKPFRFLDLPAEMRNIVYRELLVSETGYIFLFGRPYDRGDAAVSSRTQPKLREGLESGCRPVILETCKQIHNEAKDILYSENKVIMSFEVEKSIKPFIPSTHIELPSLARITSLVLVLDMCAASSLVRNHRFLSVQDFVKLVCWREMQAMTSLKQIRITTIERADIEHRQTMLRQIMDRIPVTCEVAFGMDTDYEKEYVKKVTKDADEPEHKAYYNLEDSYETDVDMLRRCGEGAMDTKGSKSGDERDYRFADRSFSKLGSLAGSETIDPRYVLGAGEC